MKPAAPTRRALLRGPAGVSIALPWLEALAPRTARAAGKARRLVIFYFSNGVTPSAYNVGGTGTAFTFSPVLAPLAPLRAKVVVLQGIHMETARSNNGNGHNVGMTNLLTARKFQDAMATEFGAVGWGAGATVDQHAAKAIGKETKFASLQLGVQANRQYKGNPYSCLSYAGPAQPLTSEDDPRKVFARLFTDGTAAPGGANVLADKKKSVLDFVKADLEAMKTRVSAGDRQKLDAHLTGLRELERRVTTVATATCKRPDAPAATMSLTRDEDYPRLGALMTDLLVAALTCDLTRVATLQWSTAQSGVWPKWEGVAPFTTWHHDMSHKTDADSTAALVRLQTWYFKQFAALGAKLDAVTEGDKTLLDDTLVLSCSEVAVGPSHSFMNLPFVLMGGGNAGIPGGRAVNFGGRSHNDLFVTLLQAMGTTDTVFGDPAFCKGPLSGLMA